MYRLESKSKINLPLFADDMIFYGDHTKTFRYKSFALLWELSNTDGPEII